jgi:hypothetical protein
MQIRCALRPSTTGRSYMQLVQADRNDAALEEARRAAPCRPFLSEHAEPAKVPYPESFEKSKAWTWHPSSEEEDQHMSIRDAVARLQKPTNQAWLGLVGGAWDDQCGGESSFSVPDRWARE